MTLTQGAITKLAPLRSILGSRWRDPASGEVLEVCSWQYPERIVSLTDGRKLHVSELVALFEEQA